MRLYSGPPPCALIGLSPEALDPSRGELAVLQDEELTRATLNTDQAARAGLSLMEMLASMKAGYEECISALEVSWQALSMRVMTYQPYSRATTSRCGTSCQLLKCRWRLVLLRWTVGRRRAGHAASSAARRRLMRGLAWRTVCTVWVFFFAGSCCWRGRQR